jgi:hypothetical protein
VKQIIIGVVLGIVIGSAVLGYGINAEEFSNLSNSTNTNQTNTVYDFIFNQNFTINMPEIEVPFTETREPIPLKDCSIHESLKKDWFDCNRYNQGILSDQLSDKIKEDNKEINRGF